MNRKLIFARLSFVFGVSVISQFAAATSSDENTLTYDQQSNTQNEQIITNSGDIFSAYDLALIDQIVTNGLANYDDAATMVRNSSLQEKTDLMSSLANGHVVLASGGGTSCTL